MTAEMLLLPFIVVVFRLVYWVRSFIAWRQRRKWARFMAAMEEAAEKSSVSLTALSSAFAGISEALKKEAA